MAGMDPTLFADEGIVAIIGVVGIACGSAPSITHDSDIKFWHDQDRQLRSDEEEIDSAQPRNSCPNRPECPELICHSEASCFKSKDQDAEYILVSKVEWLAG